MKDAQINIRCSTQEKEAWTALAKAYGTSLPDFIRFLLNCERKKAEEKERRVD